MATQVIKDRLRAEIEDQLGDNPPHTHGHQVKRPWWKYRLRFDTEATYGKWPFYWHRWDHVEVACPETLIPISNINIEVERSDLTLKVVGARRYQCPKPVVGNRLDVLMYAAKVLPEGWWPPEDTPA